MNVKLVRNRKTNLSSSVVLDSHNQVGLILGIQNSYVKKNRCHINEERKDYIIISIQVEETSSTIKYTFMIF
jgi:hypothetical protein